MCIFGGGGGVVLLFDVFAFSNDVHLADSIFFKSLWPFKAPFIIRPRPLFFSVPQLSFNEGRLFYFESTVANAFVLRWGEREQQKRLAGTWISIFFASFHTGIRINNRWHGALCLNIFLTILSLTLNLDCFRPFFISF